MLLRMRAAVRDFQMGVRTLFVLSWLLLLTALFGCSDRDVKDQDSGLAPLYGPPPNDWRAPSPDGALDVSTPREASVDACTPQPIALYGPMPCSEDTDCRSQYGANWYCNKSNSFSDSCGTQTAWPICQQDPARDAGLVGKRDGCMPVALYGPRPCSTDADCQSWYSDASYRCNKTAAFSNGCGGYSTWPTCQKK